MKHRADALGPFPFLHGSLACVTAGVALCHQVSTSVHREFAPSVRRAGLRRGSGAHHQPWDVRCRPVPLWTAQQRVHYGPTLSP